MRIIYAFEEFNHKRFGRKRQSIIPSVTITKDEIIYFNIAIMKDFIKENSYLTYHYDKERNVIGLSVSENETLKSYKITRHKTRGSATVRADAFLLYYNLKHKESKRYDDIKFENNMIIIELKDPK